MLESCLELALKKDEFTSEMCCDVVARDELPTQVVYPSCYIINTKPRTHSGEHWLAVYYDPEGNADFFDSYGQHPSYFHLKTFLIVLQKRGLIIKKEFKVFLHIAVTIVFFIYS